MDALMLARWQFGITTVYHFFFVPLTLGLSLLVAIFQTAYVRTDSDTYKRMTQFWGKLFLINFAMGVVTGIVQEFQFGMNWSEYSRFVGDIFGAPLAIEALLAFFLESTFVGVWIFGWGRLNKGLHLASIWLVVIGSNISAFWILIANSFMQQPVGYTLRNGRAEMTDFGALLTNSNLWMQFPHVFTAGVVTASFFVIGISAWHLLRKKGDIDLFRKSASIAMATAMIATVLVALVGHAQSQHMVKTQPMKIASAEALWDTESPASFSLFTIGDETANKDVFSIKIPTLLSILAYNSTTGEVKGINNLQAEYEKTYGPGDYVPPVWVVYWSFRSMVGSGTLMILLSLYGLYLVMSGKLTARSWYLKLMLFAIALPYIANTAGWMMTEIGRQPWIVFGVMTTEKGVSTSVGAESVLISLVIFTLLYGALAVVDVYLLAKYARDGASAKPGNPEEADLVGAY
ncbi:cytochrome ubiquinol oxidase subunit I [Candidatus Chlorohelix sp.]|uniref:cytochrome ubiquinol oxidase subunit I n=1 Tax=Candidatus Chlorohelix sp. TaxID=3139201 RepID=UPI003069DC65